MRSSLLDAITLARLRLCDDPWDEPGLELLDRLVLAIDCRPLPAEAVVPLRQVAFHLMGANPSRLPAALVRALLDVGVEHIGLALAAGDLERATRWAERKVGKGDLSWFALVAIARSSRADLCEVIGERLGGQKQDSSFWAELARTVDALCFESAPRLGLLVAQRALQVSDGKALVLRLDALDAGAIAHQAVLTAYLALQGSGEFECARQLLERRFDDRAKRSFAQGLAQLLSADGRAGALGTEPGRQFIESFEREHGVHGFLQGYLEAALDTDPEFARMLPAPALAAVRAEITRSYEVYRSLGGRPNVATLRKNRFYLALNDRAEVLMFNHDALILWRSVDWLAFDPDWRWRFGDARQGQGRGIALLGVPEVQLDIGDGASLLLVLADETNGPVLGEYRRFYGQAW